jgi:hypothetical protein
MKPVFLIRIRHGGIVLVVVPNQKELVDELKIEWKRLWHERVDDKVRAEGIATDDYSTLFIDKGTIIHATRDFKALNFKDILEQHEVQNAERYVSPDPRIGGWAKFVKETLPPKNSRGIHRATDLYYEEKTGKQKQRKTGRGWLHL